MIEVIQKIDYEGPEESTDSSFIGFPVKGKASMEVVAHGSNGLTIERGVMQKVASTMDITIIKKDRG